jgi:hypothetical protein
MFKDNAFKLAFDFPKADMMGFTVPESISSGMSTTFNTVKSISLDPKSIMHSEYLKKTMPILNYIIEKNPNYKQAIGTIIHPFVQDLTGNQAPKITGMLIELPIFEIHSYMKNYDLLMQRVF